MTKHRIRFLLFIIILSVGLGMRLWDIGARSVWHDEGYTMAFVRAPASDMNGFIAFDVHPPLYYWALRGWMAPVDPGAFAVTWARLFSAVCALIALGLTFDLGRRIGGIGVGLLGMALLAISPAAIHYAQEIRMYSLLTIFTVAMMIAGREALRRPTAFRVALTTLFGVLAAYTQYIAGILLIGWFLTLPWIRRPGENGYGRGFVRASVAALGAALLYWPWLSTGLSHVLNNAFSGLYSASKFTPVGPADYYAWAVEASLGFVPSIPFGRTLLVDAWSQRMAARWAIPLALVLMGVAAGIGILRTRRRMGGRSFLGAFLLVPLLLIAMYLLAGGRFYSRLLIILAPLGFILIAAGLREMRSRVLRWAMGGAIAAMLLASSAATLGVDLRDVSRDAALRLAELRETFGDLPAADAPVLHAAPHSFWNLMAYDSKPDRHFMLATPETPAIVYIMFGDRAIVTKRKLDDMNIAWVAFSEWSPGPPELRHRIEPLWFENWEQKGPIVYDRRFIKQIELGLYERKE